MTRDPLPPETTTTIAVTLTRIEGTLAVIDEKITNLARTDHDHEMRLRILEARPVFDPKDLRALAADLATVAGRPYVSPRTIWLAVGTFAALASALGPILDRLYF